MVVLLSIGSVGIKYVYLNCRLKSHFHLFQWNILNIIWHWETDISIWNLWHSPVHTFIALPNSVSCLEHLHEMFSLHFTSLLTFQGVQHNNFCYHTIILTLESSVFFSVFTLFWFFKTLFRKNDSKRRLLETFQVTFFLKLFPGPQLFGRFEPLSEANLKFLGSQNLVKNAKKHVFFSN